MKIKQSKGAKKKAKAEISEIDRAEMEATEAFTFYLNRTASVEILTNFELLKVYFTIPNACVIMNRTLIQRIIEEMTESDPKEAIKYI